ncbi:MAG: ATP-binding cassette domain-containing protein [Planctomycetota bacterium]|nr:MAG: ATP-binding cassette domain-containing protein [Planctomycetota bacterium]
MASALWRLDGVTMPGRGRPRLDRLTAEIPSGVTAIIGDSGAGKTTLLNLLVGFEQPGTGNVDSFLDAENAPPLAWCPPDDGLWPHLTVQRHLELVAPHAGVMIDSILRDFDLEGLARAEADRLSAGEAARLSAARAVASGARVLVMDEPFVHVNPAREERYWAAVRTAIEERRGSLVFASHQPEIVLREATHVLCLDEGRLIWQGPVQTLYHEPPACDVARFLGPINWFEDGEASRWLGATAEGAVRVRPEKLSLDVSETGPHFVEEARFCGGVAVADLRHETSGARRRVYHRPVSDSLRRGMRVALRAALAGLLAILVCGCDGSSDGPSVQLPVSEVHSRSLPAEEGFLPAPRAMTFGPDGMLYVLDDAGRVLVYDSEGELARRWRMPESDVGNPEGICVLRDGRVCVADTHYHRCVFFDEAGEFLGTFGENGEGPGQFIFPCGVVQDSQGNVYVSEYGGNDRIQKFTEDGECLMQFGSVGTEPGQFQRASGLAWHDGTVYVADAINNRIQAFRDSGEFDRIVNRAGSADLDYPYDVAVQDESLYVVEYKAGRVSRLSFEGEVIGRFGSTGRGENQFWTPWGLAVNSQGRIVVGDTGNRRMVELVP